MITNHRCASHPFGRMEAFLQFAENTHAPGLKTRGVMRKQPRRIDMPIAKSSHDGLAIPDNEFKLAKPKYKDFGWETGRILMFKEVIGDTLSVYYCQMYWPLDTAIRNKINGWIIPKPTPKKHVSIFQAFWDQPHSLFLCSFQSFLHWPPCHRATLILFYRMNCALLRSSWQRPYSNRASG